MSKDDEYDYLFKGAALSWFAAAGSWVESATATQLPTDRARASMGELSRAESSSVLMRRVRGRLLWL